MRESAKMAQTHTDIERLTDSAPEVAAILPRSTPCLTKKGPEICYTILECGEDDAVDVAAADAAALGVSQVKGNCS